jgi:predicted outer membrane repeat protein
MRNTSFMNNHANFQGGAIKMESGVLNIDDTVTFTGNIANESGNDISRYPSSLIMDCKKL